MKPVLVLLITCLLASCSFNEKGDGFSKNNMKFPETLSAFKLFKGEMNKLIPADSVIILELSSTLFTDYAEKQRLLKLPPGTKMTSKGDGLPDFPDGAILAKTFYYMATQTKGKQQIIETRILIRNKGKWNVATYKWNDSQTDAVLLNDGATVPVTITRPDGDRQEINYKIPTVYDCYDCHRSSNELVPIGSKLRNLNVNMFNEGKMVSQLEVLKRKGFLTIDGHKNVGRLPSYKDTSLPMEQRARAYFEINCAHCHNPKGFAGAYSLDLRFENDYEDIGIFFNKWNIEHRMTIRDMPKLGTTIVDKEGLLMVKHYLATLKKE